jgi:hypothetical protein
VKNRIVLYFYAAQSEQPIIYRLVKEYDLVVNILKANINPQKDSLKPRFRSPNQLPRWKNPLIWGWPYAYP